MLFEFIVVGLFSGLFLRMPYRFVTRNFFYIPYRWEIQVCSVIGLLIGLIFLFCAYTSVYIDENEVTVLKRFQRHTYPIDVHLSIGEKNINIKGVSLEKRWLIIKPLLNKSESTKKYRLNAFSDSTCEKLINHMNLLHCHNMPITIKNIVTESSWEGSEYFELDTKRIIRREWESIRTNSLLFLAVFTVVLIIVYFSNRYDRQIYKYIVYIIGLLACLIKIPFEIVKTKRNAKRSLNKISFKGDHLMINDDHYMIPDIRLLTATHKNIKSRSLYPVQRYIILKNYDGVRHKYWCGSEYSISAADYGDLVRILVDAFLNCPEKLKLLTKRSFWSK